MKKFDFDSGIRILTVLATVYLISVIGLLIWRAAT